MPLSSTPDAIWSLAKFNENLRASVKRLSQRSIEFDLVGVDASIANAFRRILIAEAQRKVRACKKAPKDTPQIIHDVVTTGDLVWEPQGEQGAVFAANPPASMNKDIVLANLAREQILEIEMHALKEHAKWSAVATASYRLDPLVVLKPSTPVPREHAEKFARCFSMGVVRIGAHEEFSIDERNLRKETMSREVLRHMEFEGCVELKRVRDWFIFSIESEGPYTPTLLLPEAIKIMRGKIASISTAEEALLADSEDLGSGAVVGGPDADGDVEMNGE
ncbi:insert subdomain of RNA polymerase alpha subunit [Ganoderma leucocontextum]|nr:insert subdomain of RNA polymerase alpha subunit [Ganoderma leucocontextum]